MALTYHQAVLVKASFQEARQHLKPGSTRLFDILAEIDPALDARFQRDRARHQAKLMRQMGTIIEMLPYPRIVDQMFEDLAKLHQHRAVRVRDFVPFNSAMVALMAETLGDRFTSELEVAWRATLSDLTRRMISKGRFQV